MAISFPTKPKAHADAVPIDETDFEHTLWSYLLRANLSVGLEGVSEPLGDIFSHWNIPVASLSDQCRHLVAGTLSRWKTHVSLGHWHSEKPPQESRWEWVPERLVKAQKEWNL